MRYLCNSTTIPGNWKITLIALIGCIAWVLPWYGFSAERIVSEIILDRPGDANEPDFLEEIAEIEKSLSIEPGDPFSAENVQEQTRSLFQSGMFSQIRVYSDEKDGSVSLRFFLIPKTHIEQIIFSGNETLDDSELLRAIRLRVGEYVFPDDLNPASYRLESAYRRRGFTRAFIRAQLVPTSRPYRSVLRFDVTEGRPVRVQSIRFTGDTIFKIRKLKRAFGIKPGDRVDLPGILDEIKKLRDLYRSKGFEEARFELLDADEERWRESILFNQGILKINIEAGDRIRLHFRGNRLFSDDELQRILKLDEQDIFSYNYSTLDKIKLGLIDFYQREGYLHVDVSVAVSKKLRRKNIYFRIREGKRVKLREVLFAGNDTLASRDLRKELFAVVRERLTRDEEWEKRFEQRFASPNGRSTYRMENDARRYGRWSVPAYDRPEPLDSDQVYVPNVYEEGRLALVQLYRENGFISCEIGEPQLCFNDTGQRLTLTFPVEEGPQTIIRSITVVGEKVKSESEIIKISGFALDAPLNDLAFEEITRTLKRAYAQDGYIYAIIDISYTLTKNRMGAQLLIGISEGPQVRVGDVLIAGNVVTKRKTILQELTFESGDVYRPDEVKESQKWLQRLGIFQALTLKPWNPEKEEAVKKVLLSVKERNPGRFEFSAGLATDEGVRLGFLFIYRNLFGSALEYRMRGKVNYRIPPLLDDEFEKLYNELSFLNALEREASVGFYWPSILGSHVGFRTDVVHLRRQERAYGLDKNSIQIGFDTEYIPYLKLAFLNEFGYVNSEKTTLKAIWENEFVPENQRGWEYSPKLQLIFDYRDNVFDPTYGIVINALGEYFEAFETDNDVDLVRVSGSVAGYIPIPGPRHPIVLKFTAKSGVIERVHGSITPVDKTFKLGGRTSLRGFGEEAVYPSDGADDQIEEPSQGGNFYLLFKTDLRIPIYKNYYLGVFNDIGALWLKPDNISGSYNQYKKSAGGGLHYRTPVGDISLEVGWNLDPKPELKEDDWRLHFSISLF